jgi:hypothetical protein
VLEARNGTARAVLGVGRDVGEALDQIEDDVRPRPPARRGGRPPGGAPVMDPRMETIGGRAQERGRRR